MLVEASSQSSVHTAASSARQQGRKVLFSAMKNEAPFILEWVAYHLEIGFEDIIIFSNESEDGTTELLDALAASDVIAHYPHTPPKGVSAQVNAARIANDEQLLKHGDWVLWIDADEFLNVKIGDGMVDDLIALIGDRHGMLINWRIFGDGGNTYFPGRFVSAQFSGSSRKRFVSNLEAKTLFRHGPEIEGLALDGIHRPVIKADAGLGADSFLNGNGQVAAGGRKHLEWLAGADSWSNSRISDVDTGGRVAQLNHYCVRTPEMFALKRRRGRGWAPDQQGDANERHSGRFYRRMNKNGRIDKTILRHEKAVTRRMKELEALPGVYAAQNTGRKRTAIAVAHQQKPNVKPSLSDVLRTKNTDLPLVTLPAEEEKLVTEHYKRADSVLEYGSGGSTAIAVRSKVAHLCSVESDPVWAENVENALNHHFPSADFVIHYEDIGPTGAWGYPQSSSHSKTYHRYATSIWDIPGFVQPDVVLIDGRFRTACFCTTVMKAAKPVTILFDDYVDRPEYHWVEDMLPREETVGRMVRFNLTEKIDLAPFLSRVAGSFVDVR